MAVTFYACVCVCVCVALQRWLFSFQEVGGFAGSGEERASPHIFWEDSSTGGLQHLPHAEGCKWWTESHHATQTPQDTSTPSEWGT